MAIITKRENILLVTDIVPLSFTFDASPARQ
jgi:hypothetical protein